MTHDLSQKLIVDFENGKLSRRQLAQRLISLGAALATIDAAEAQQTQAESSTSLFKAKGLHHIALDVVDVPRSRNFYQKTLGMDVIRGDDEALFMGADREFFLTLFRAEKAGLNHYCYGIEDYDVASAVAKLREAGINPRQTGGRVYFPDPDGIEVQVASAR